MHINMNMELGGQQQQNFEREYKIRSLLRCCFLAGNFFLPFFLSFHGARLSSFFFFSLSCAHFLHFHFYLLSLRARVSGFHHAIKAYVQKSMRLINHFFARFCIYFVYPSIQCRSMLGYCSC